MSSSDAPAVAEARPGIPRLEYRIERLRTNLRFTYAFHTREVRFERDAGDGFVRIFPETFSFRAERHDPAELYLQLEDVWTKPQLISPKGNRRDAENLMSRLAEGLPGYLERVIDQLESQPGIDERILTQVYEDTGLVALVMGRFLEDKQLDTERLRMSGFHLRRVSLRAFGALVHRRVEPDFTERYVSGSLDPVDAGDDLSEIGIFYTLQMGEAGAVNRTVVRVAERCFHRWLEDVCLDESNRAFETEKSPFDDRESEVLRAVCVPGRTSIERSSDLIPFLRRPGNRDCLRVLSKLERWFLRQYDVPHGAAVIHHEADLLHGRSGDRQLSVHRVRNYLLALAVVAAPFVGAAFAYQRAPAFFDAVAALFVMAGIGASFWFFAYRFVWKRDLAFFHASVPRITAGIIVGYAPVFLIDEVWDLARSPWPQLVVVMLLLGFTTLLYLYVEVKSRLKDAPEAFERARSLFLLGVLQAVGIGFVISSLLGPFMAARNWGGGGQLPVEWLAGTAAPVIGQLPPILGIGPFYAFPSAVLLFTFLSFFIGTFLQLLWEDLPITEPM